MRNSRALIVALAIASALFVLGQLFFVPTRYVHSALMQALQAPAVFFSSLKNQHTIITQLGELQRENQSLRAQLAEAVSRPTLVQDRRSSYLRVPVYSNYPLNNTSRIVIAAGSAAGITEGMSVVLEPGVFIGEVVSTALHYSEVRTLRDLGWELPVKIGPANVDSLLVGGHEPRLTLISRKKPAEAGLEVRLASKKHPYGLLVGTVGSLEPSDNNLFEEASVVAPYIFGEVDQVYVVMTQ
jgi:cell shape-determining protein MreC